MSRSTFLTTNETSSTTAVRFHHAPISTISSINRSNEINSPLVVQSSAMTDSTTITNKNNIQHKSTARLNPRIIKRNLKNKRRPTGIRPDEVSLASTSTDGSADENDDEEDKALTRNQFITITNSQPSESLDRNQTVISSSPSKSVLKVSRVQSSFENLSIPRTDPHVVISSSSSNIYSGSTPKTFQPEKFIIRRQPADNDDSSTLKHRPLEERIHTLESLVYDKDTIINDLQRKLNTATRDLADAEQQIFILNQDKLTLIKAFTSLQDNTPSSEDISKRSNFVKRN